MPKTMMPPDGAGSGELDFESSGAALVLVIVGMCLPSGSGFALASARWPVFMPDELDAVAALLRLLGEPAGTYLAAVAMGVLGGGCIYTGVLGCRRS